MTGSVLKIRRTGELVVAMGFDDAGLLLVQRAGGETFNLREDYEVVAKHWTKHNYDYWTGALHAN